jgi:dienelactone hydrolase
MAATLRSRSALAIPLATATLVLLASAALAQAPQSPPAASAPTGPPLPYVSPDTPQGSGPFPALMEAAPGLPTHTLYRPARLDAPGLAKMPLVVWGNGACVNTGNRFRYFLSEIASHGFVVLALGPIGPREAEWNPASPASRQAPAPGSPGAKAEALGKRPPANATGSARPADTTAEQMIDAIDWAETLKSGALAARIDMAQVAVMGQSCGGLQAIAASQDKRVKTLGVWNSGLFDHPNRAWEIAAAPVNKANLSNLHTPAIYVTGEPSEVAFKNADDDVARIQGLPVFRAWMHGTGHSGTYREVNGGAYAPVAVAWLKWRLKGDTEAAAMFRGSDCKLCKDPRWNVSKKGID